jgi:hypothetical protein
MVVSQFFLSVCMNLNIEFRSKTKLIAEVFHPLGLIGLKVRKLFVFPSAILFKCLIMTQEFQLSFLSLFNKKNTKAFFAALVFFLFN